MKKLLLLSSLFVLFLACKKDKPVHYYLKTDASYVSSSLLLKGKPRVFVANKEITDAAVVKALVRRYPELFSDADTTYSFPDTISVDAQGNVLMKHLIPYKKTQYSVSYDNNNATFSQVDTIIDQQMVYYPAYTRKIDSILNPSLNRYAVRTPVSNAVHGTSYYFEKEYVTMQQNSFLHHYCDIWCITDTVNIFSGRLQWGVKDNPAPALSGKDTIILQDGVAEYSPL